MLTSGKVGEKRGISLSLVRLSDEHSKLFRSRHAGIAGSESNHPSGSCGIALGVSASGEIGKLAGLNGFEIQEEQFSRVLPLQTICRRQCCWLDGGAARNAALETRG
jgi:hypothetical protein